MRIVLCCLLLVACGGNPGPESGVPAGGGLAAPPLRTFDRTLHATTFNGTRLTYRVTGDSGAPPVVFVHGTLADLNSWGGQENLFAQRYRVLVYSRRYHRPNPQADDHQTYSPKLHSEDLAAMLLTLDLAPAEIIGSSYGAYTALQLVRDHPQLVRGLVLAEPPIFSLLTASEEGDAARRTFFTYALDPARAAFARGDSVAGVRLFFDATTGRGAFDRLTPAGRATLLTHAFELRREMLAERSDYLPPLTCDELGRITTPVLLVRGERSPRMFQLITDELARCLHNDTTVVIPGAGHPPQVGNPGYFNLVVLRYIASH
jgi:non-heme chloroperoxidase